MTLVLWLIGYDWKIKNTALCDADFNCSGLCRNISDVLWEAISTRQVLSLYQGLGTKNLQSFISQFVYFYGYSFFKRLYLEKSGNKTIGTRANLIVSAATGACTVIVTQVSYTLTSFSSQGNTFLFCFLDVVCLGFLQITWCLSCQRGLD